MNGFRIRQERLRLGCCQVVALGEVWELFEGYPVRDESDLPSSEEEVLDALNTVKGNKAGGKNKMLHSVVVQAFWSTSWSCFIKYGMMNVYLRSGRMYL